MGKKTPKGNRIDPDAIRANVADLDKNIDFEGLKGRLSEDTYQQFSEEAGQWRETEIRGRDGKSLTVLSEIRESLVDLAERFLVSQTVSSKNALEDVYRNGLVADEVIKIFEGLKAKNGGFYGWCEKQGASRSTMYRDRKLATHFDRGIMDCVGVSENKLYTCLTLKKGIDWVLANKQVLIEAPNVETVKTICRGPQSEKTTPNEDTVEFKPRTNCVTSRKRDGSWVVRIENLHEEELTFLQKWNDDLPGNRPQQAGALPADQSVSKALDTNEHRTGDVKDDGAVGDVIAEEQPPVVVQVDGPSSQAEDGETSEEDVDDEAEGEYEDEGGDDDEDDYLLQKRHLVFDGDHYGEDHMTMN